MFTIKMILKLLNKTVAGAYESTGTWRQALEVDLKVGSKLRKWSGKEDVALGEDRKVRENLKGGPESRRQAIKGNLASRHILIHLD
jgi:hypothetical protein